VTDSPWLSIVTVLKDDRPGLERTLASLSGSERHGVEHIIIDSSSDRTSSPALVGASGLRSRIIWTEPAGVYAAMNRGLAEATGTFVLFLNAGDELASDRVITVLREAVTEGAVNWLFGDAEIVGVDGTVVTTPPWDYRREQKSSFSQGHFPAHQATVVRTAVLRAVGGFDESYQIAADYGVFLHLTEVGPPLQLKFTIARFHEGGASTTGWARSILEFHRARRAILLPTGPVARVERWNTVRQFTIMAAHRSPWPLIAALVTLVLAVLITTGAAWMESTTLTLLVLIQGLAGAAWWRMLQPARSVPVLEAVGMGLGLGTAGAMLFGLFSWWWLMVVVVTAAWLIVSFRRRVAPLAPLTRPDLAALAVGLVPGIGALALALRNYPLSWVGAWAGYHGDMPFFEALAASVARLGPGASIFMDGASLKYHSLVYGWAGQLTLSVDAQPFVVLTRLLPLIGLIGATALTAAWARQLTRARWAPALAVGLVITGGFVGATYGSVLNMDSPSQTMGTVWLLTLSMCSLQGLLRGNLFAHALAIATLSIALAGGKISTAAIAAAGLAVVLVVALIRREAWRWRALAITAIAGLAMIVTFLLLLAGSANSGGLGLFTLLDRASSLQGLNPIVTPRGIAAGIALLILATLPRWAGLAWLVGDRLTRWQPETTYGVGLALGGIGALVVLSGGFNDLWFAVAASAPLAVLSSIGVAAVVAWLGPSAQNRVIAAAIGGLLSCIVVAAIWTTGSTGVLGNGWRWTGPVLGVFFAAAVGLALARGSLTPYLRSAAGLMIIALVTSALPARIVYAIAEPLARPSEGTRSAVVFSPQDEFVVTLDPDRELVWTDTQSAAGTWLRDNAEPDDLIATNLTLGALVPALTRLTTYVSDIHMQASYGRIGDLAEVQERERETWAFIDSPSPQTVSPLCRAGVQWLWIDPDRTVRRDWSPQADVVWSATDVTIARLDRTSCP
jgi:hypothetical protein